MIIDVHAHISDERLIGNIDEIIRNAKNCGVEKIICASFNKETSKQAVELAERFPFVYATIGIHPSEIDEFDSEFEKFLFDNAKNKKVVAIGEIGLDYHYEPFDKNKQKEVFIRQMTIANTVCLPIEVHSRDATTETIEVLTKNKNLLKNGGIVHCFSGNYEELLQVQKLGLKISIGGIVTFKNAKDLVEMLKKAPLEMLTLETDCPYLTPTPHRGEINKPEYVPFILQKIAEIKDIEVSNLEKIIENNTVDVFKKINCK